MLGTLGGLAALAALLALLLWRRRRTAKAPSVRSPEEPAYLASLRKHQTRTDGLRCPPDDKEKKTPPTIALTGRPSPGSWPMTRETPTADSSQLSTNTTSQEEGLSSAVLRSQLCPYPSHLCPYRPSPASLTAS